MRTGQADSLPAVQEIFIRNVNDPTQIFFKPVSINVPQFHTIETDTDTNTDTDITTDASSIDMPQSTSGKSTAPGSTIVTGFSVVDIDLGVDPVHVTMSTTNGSKVLLNSKFLKYVDFNSAGYCMSPSVDWSCYGDGSVDRLSFVGTPDDVVRVLNGMVLTMGQHNQDLLEITLYDGVVSKITLYDATLLQNSFSYFIFTVVS
jgi:hypothetical protein